jgi:hypothetical protein
MSIKTKKIVKKIIIFIFWLGSFIGILSVRLLGGGHHPHLSKLNKKIGEVINNSNVISSANADGLIGGCSSGGCGCTCPGCSSGACEGS